MPASWNLLHWAVKGSQYKATIEELISKLDYNILPQLFFERVNLLKGVIAIFYIIDLAISVGHSRLETGCTKQTGLI